MLVCLPLSLNVDVVIVVVVDKYPLGHHVSAAHEDDVISQSSHDAVTTSPAKYNEITQTG